MDGSINALAVLIHVQDLTISVWELDVDLSLDIPSPLQKPPSKATAAADLFLHFLFLS